MSAPIYLDYAATTPVAPEVARAMGEALGAKADFGNPSSVTHSFGRRAEARIEAARAKVASLIGASPEDIVFTSGATESNNLALLGVARASVAPAGAGKARHIVTTKIEHKAVLDPCKQLEREGFSVTYLVPDSSGQVRPETLRAAMRPETVLVSVMHANNETGVIQDIVAMGAVCRERGVPFHVDAAQSVGKLPIDVSTLVVDLLSFTAHKIYGPKGIGALYVAASARARLRPVSFGGGQERGLRPGTLPTHQIVGFGAAAELAASELSSEPARLTALRDRLWQALSRIEGVHLNGEAAPRLSGILNVSFEGVEGESLVTGLGMLAVSTGSACSSASGDASYVLKALGRNTQLAQSSLRFSVGRLTTEVDVDIAARAVIRHVERLRALSPAGSGVVAEMADNRGELSRPADSATQAADFTSETASARLAAAGRTWPDTLNPQVRDLFERLPGAGAPPSHARWISATAGGVAAEAWLRIHLDVDPKGIVKRALFQAWGCPHTLAVAAWVTARLEGRSLTDLLPGTPSAWLEMLEVPVEKLGRLLVVEDALRGAMEQWKSFSP